MLAPRGPNKYTTPLYSPRGNAWGATNILFHCTCHMSTPGGRRNTIPLCSLHGSAAGTEQTRFAYPHQPIPKQPLSRRALVIGSCRSVVPARARGGRRERRLTRRARRRRRRRRVNIRTSAIVRSGSVWEASWGHRRALLGTCWKSLGPYWGSLEALLGRSWGSLGAFLAALEALLGTSWRLSVKREGSFSSVSPLVGALK